MTSISPMVAKVARGSYTGRGSPAIGGLSPMSSIASVGYTPRGSVILDSTSTSISRPSTVPIEAMDQATGFIMTPPTPSPRHGDIPGVYERH